MNSIRGRRLPSPIGVSPIDESVYGVRDLEGSADELTSGRTIEGQSYISIRGGGWTVPDEYRYRVTTRLGRLPLAYDRGTGFRLVAEMK